MQLIQIISNWLNWKLYTWAMQHCFANTVRLSIFPGHARPSSSACHVRLISTTLWSSKHVDHQPCMEAHLIICHLMSPLIGIWQTPGRPQYMPVGLCSVQWDTELAIEAHAQISRKLDMPTEACLCSHFFIPFTCRASLTPASYSCSSRSATWPHLLAAPTKTVIHVKQLQHNKDKIGVNREIVSL